MRTFMPNWLKEFLLQKALHVIRLFLSSQQQPPPISFDLEALAPEPSPISYRKNIEWGKVVVSFCSASAFNIATLAAQIQSPLPRIYHWLSLGLTFSFTAMFVGRCIKSKFKVASCLLEGLGIIFGVISLFIAIAIPLPLCLQIVIWTFCGISLLVFVISSLYSSRTED